MKSQRKYKLRVVNLGVKLFCKNRDDKSVGKVRIIHIFKLNIVSSIIRGIRIINAIYEGREKIQCFKAFIR